MWYWFANNYNDISRAIMPIVYIPLWKKQNWQLFKENQKKLRESRTLGCRDMDYTVFL